MIISQIVLPDQNPFKFIVKYDLTDEGRFITDLSLQAHFDSSSADIVSFQQELQVFAQEFNLSIQDDAADDDKDAATDKFIEFSWTDLNLPRAVESALPKTLTALMSNELAYLAKLPATPATVDLRNGLDLTSGILSPPAAGVSAPGDASPAEKTDGGTGSSLAASPDGESNDPALTPSSTGFAPPIPSPQLQSVQQDRTQAPTFDLDGNGRTDALTDGLIALGNMFGAPASQLATFAAAGSPGRDPVVLEQRLTEARATLFDVDGNGRFDALTDGLMILGFMFGAPATQLAGFAASDATRTDPAEIASFLADAVASGGGSGDVTLTGDIEDDTLTGGAGDDVLSGIRGNDLLSGLAGADSIDGGSGDDTVFGGDGADTIDGRNGDDTLAGDAGDDRVFGGNGDDTMTGGAGNDLLEAGNGFDTVTGDAGADELFGGNDDDVLNGGTGDDSLFGGNGDDTLSGDSGDDEIFGGNGDDVLNGGAGLDLLVGGNGDDSVNSSATLEDIVFGGLGDDTVDFSAVKGGIVVLPIELGDLPAYAVAGFELGTDVVSSFAEVENVIGTRDSDFFFPSGDRLSIDGGDGIDAVTYETLFSGINANLSLGIVRRSGELDRISNIENIVGSNGNDTLTGSSGADFLTALFGNDNLKGRDGDDFLLAGEGALEILDGDSGQDLLMTSGQGGGRVRMTGDEGADIFSILRNGTEAFNRILEITDFGQSGGIDADDTIDLSNLRTSRNLQLSLQDVLNATNDNNGSAIIDLSGFRTSAGADVNGQITLSGVAKNSLDASDFAFNEAQLDAAITSNDLQGLFDFAQELIFV